MVTGGVRSGKSEWAEQLVAKQPSVLYIATSVYSDEDFQERVRLHQERRPQSWVLWEEGVHLGKIGEFINSLAMPPRAILVDCLSGWVSNLMFQYNMDQLQDPIQWQEIEAHSIAHVGQGLAHLLETNVPIAVVTSEVGLGVVPETLLGRRYQDLLGRCNRLLASKADEVYWVVSGIPVRIKPGSLSHS